LLFLESKKSFQISFAKSNQGQSIMSTDPSRLVMGVAFKHMASYFGELGRKMESSMPIESILAEASAVLAASGALPQAVAASVVSDPAPDVKSEAAEASSKKKSGKRKRDPLMPKRPKTAFILHNQKYTPLLKKERPGVKITMTLLAEHWKATVDPERATFEAEAKVLNVEYKKKMAVYKELKAKELKAIQAAQPAAEVEDVSTSQPKRKKKKKKRDPLQPKRPLSGFLRHNAKYRSIVKEENPEAKAKEMMGLLATHWKAYPAADRKKLTDAADKEMVEFKITMAAYKAGKVSEVSATAAAVPAAAAAPALLAGTTPGKTSEKKLKKKKKSKDAAEAGTSTPAESETGKKRKKKKKAKSTKKKKKSSQSKKLL